MDVFTNDAAAQGALTSQLGPTAWAILCAVAIFVFALYSVVLIYHWYSYSMNRRVARVATIFYLTIGSVFAISLFTYTVTLMSL